ncbi:hypothetical protein CW748_09520 [Alteromonadales bacterium alter-6D02]|nr:hypothetical protein CW748_09520 [Alteromonadales bacterium alter-6D02]
MYQAEQAMQVERRFHPRYPYRVQVEVNIDEHPFSTTSVNLSEGGIQLEADNSMVKAFEQLPHPPQCIIRIPQPAPLSLACRLVVKRRLAQTHYLLGFKFLFNNDNESEQLSHFISTLTN